MHVRFSLTIDSGNAAFGETPEDAIAEVERIIDDLSERFHRGPWVGDTPIRDINGNRVGEWSLAITDD